MRIVCISDTHNKHKLLNIPKCDLLLHAGDITLRGYGNNYKRFGQWFEHQPAKHKVVVPGNHDFYCQEHLDNAMKFAKKRGFHLLVDRAVEIEGLTIYGSPWQPWFHDWAWNFPRDDDGTVAKAKWAEIPDETNILITHGPPYGILDWVHHTFYNSDHHVGCPHLLARLKQLPELKLHVFGHIHESFGQHKENGVHFVNAAQHTLHMQAHDRPVLVEL